jgi:hypothetical protein
MRLLIESNTRQTLDYALTLKKSQNGARFQG